MMQRALALTQSTVGKKVLIAITGAILFGFVLTHLIENLQLLLGRDVYNTYCEFMKSDRMFPIRWAVRSLLLASLVTHIGLTIQLAARNSSARPTAYQHVRKDAVTSYAARTMVLSGPLLLAYILFHLAHFTAPGLSLGGAFSHTDIYSNVVQSFRVWWVSALYMFANFLLGLHLYHGAWSLFQSLGLSHPKFDRLRKLGASSIAIALAGGNILIPVAVMARFIGADV